MLNIPRRVTGITHPHICDVYLKQEARGDYGNEDVLVIETDLNDKMNSANFDNDMMGLLGDLQDLQTQVEQQGGRFDRVDIRTH